MHARTQLAILSHNDGIGRKQAVTKSNKPRTKTQFSKVTQEWVAKKVMEPKKMTFISEIMEEVPKVDPKTDEKNEKIEILPKNIALVSNPGKEIILARQRSRFA